MERTNNKILFGISIIVLISATLWAKGILQEPTVAVISAILTSIGYYFAITETSKKRLERGNSKEQVNQIHHGSGDNVAGDKIIK